MSNEKKVIKVMTPRGMNQKLMKVFNCCSATVSQAIRGAHNSEMAQKIRKVAVEMGGDPIYEMEIEE
jgi:hypothetical protein